MGRLLSNLVRLLKYGHMVLAHNQIIIFQSVYSFIYESRIPLATIRAPVNTSSVNTSRDIYKDTCRSSVDPITHNKNTN